MVNDSEFLLGLLGKPVRIVAVDEDSVPSLSSLILKEVSALGVVAGDTRTLRFFPWHEIVEIHSAGEGAPGDENSADGELVDALLGLDSEP